MRDPISRRTLIPYSTDMKALKRSQQCESSIHVCTICIGFAKRFANVFFFAFILIVHEIRFFFQG